MPTASIPDAFADALGRIIAKERDAWRKEREVAQAEARQTIAELGRKVAEFELALHQLQIADHERIAERIALIKDGMNGLPGLNGKDGEPGKDGHDGTDGKDGLNGRDGADGNHGMNGKDGEPGKDGRDGRDGIDGKDGLKGKDGLDGERGIEGATGKFAGLKEWRRGIHYETQLVVHGGSTYCANCDTAETPPHDDWSLVAAKGVDAPVGEVHGLYSSTAKYCKFDLVVFNGAEWRAKKDDPGALPGDGWALSAKQGERGKMGPRGPEGPSGKEGKPGQAGVAIVEWVRDGYRAIPMMSDGTAGPSLNMRDFFERYHGES